MIGGSNSTPRGVQTLITGIGSVSVLAVNPTNERYKEITGQDARFPFKYDLVTVGEQGQARPIQFLVHNEEKGVYEFVKFLLFNTDEISKTGKMHSIDGVGRTAYIDTRESNQYNWFNSMDSRTLKRGEASIHKFLQALVKYNPDAEGAQWVVDMASANVTAERLYNGDVAGLQSLLDWAGSTTVDKTHKGHKVGVLFTVKKTPKTNKETGEEIPNEFYFNQEVHAHREGKTFYFCQADGTVSQGAFKYLKKFETEQKEAGYSVTNRLYTIGLQDFVETDCRNAEPVDVVEESASEEVLTWD